MKHKTIILCGSSRAGKTTLAKLASKHSRTHKGLTFEALFPAYLSRLSYLLKSKHQMLFREYMQRPRYIDEGKLKTITPALELGSDQYEFSNDLLSSLTRNFGEQWIIADLHAELYYKQLLKVMPDLHFILVTRDPRECICAALYWQSYPECISGRKLFFYKSLFSWILSYSVAKKIQANHTDKITIINSNALRKEKQLPEYLNFDSLWKTDIIGDAYYTYLGNRVFTTPVQFENRELLTAKELSMIECLCRTEMCELGFRQVSGGVNSRLYFMRGCINIMRIIANLSPSLARGYIDLLFSPLQHAKKQLERLKQFIKDIKNF